MWVSTKEPVSNPNINGEGGGGSVSIIEKGIRIECPYSWF